MIRLREAEMGFEYDHDDLGHTTIVTESRPWWKFFRHVYHVRCCELNCSFHVGPLDNLYVANALAKQFWGTNFKTVPPRSHRGGY